MIDIAAHGLYPAAAVRGGFFRGRRAWNNSSRPPPNSQAAHTGRWSHFLGGGGWDSDPGEHTVWDDMNATVGGIATFAQVAAKLPEAKYDSSLSHPRKQDKGFRKDVVAPAKVIAIDQTFDGEEEDEYEDVPICAACETQLFIPEAEGSKEASRPCAIRCGHLICAACYVKGRSFSRKQSNRKRNATRAAKTATSSKGKKKDAAAATIQKEPTNGIDIETQGIVERLEPGEWIGCPVPTCDGAGTQWQRKLGHPEGLWEVYLSVE